MCDIKSGYEDRSIVSGETSDKKGEVIAAKHTDGCLVGFHLQWKQEKKIQWIFERVLFYIYEYF